MSGANLPPAWIKAAARQPMQTPAYVYSMAQVTWQMHSLREALGTPIVVMVAACNNPDVLARLPEDVRFGARCASRHEMNIVSAWKSDHLYVGMPALEAPSARAALGGRYRIIIDAPQQLETLAELRGARRVAPVTLSLARSLAGADGISLQGMDREAFLLAMERSLKHDIQIGGVQMYAGRNGFAAHGLGVAKALRELVQAAEDRLGYRLLTVNLGGGLEDDWWRHGHDFAAYRGELSHFPSHLQLMHELGRSIFAPAGAFLTRVVGIKRTQGRALAVCDGGRVQAQALAGIGTEGRTSPLVLRGGEVLPEAAAAEAAEATFVCGASAGDGDLLAQCAQALRVGDLLAFPGAGAYMQSGSPTQYLGHAQAHTYVCS
jgi:diaminopimelate decarboxylase